MLDMAVKFYTIVTKGLILKFKMFCVLIPMFVELTGENLVGGFIAHPTSLIGLITTQQVNLLFKSLNQLVNLSTSFEHVHGFD